MATDIVIASPIVGTIAEFIDYALIAVLLMSVYYLFRFIFFGPGESAEEVQGRRDKFGNWLHEQKEKKKHEDEAQTQAATKQREADVRRHLLEPVKGFIIRVEKTTEEMSDYVQHQNSYSHAGAEHYVQLMNSNLRSARRTLHVARTHSKGEKRDFMNHLSNYVQAMEDVVRDAVGGNVPHDHADAHWAAKVSALRSNLSQLRSRCGLLIKSIDDFIDADSAVAPAVAAGAGMHAGTTSTGRAPPAYHP